MVQRDKAMTINPEHITLHMTFGRRTLNNRTMCFIAMAMRRLRERGHSFM